MAKRKTGFRVDSWWIAGGAGTMLIAAAFPTASIALAAVGFAVLAEAVWIRHGAR